MPAVTGAPLLMGIMAAGAAAALALLAVTVGVQAGRFLVGRWRRRAEEGARPLVLQAVAGEGVPEEAVAARGWRGRAVERVAFSYLARVRGEGHELLADLLQRRGVPARIIRQSQGRSRVRRAAAAAKLGLIATAEAARQLEHLATSDPRPQVRIAAARGLGRTGEPAAADTLLSLLPGEQVPAGIIASALLALGPDAAPALRHALQAERGDDAERAMAAEVLGLLDEMTACPDLIACSASSSRQLRISAVRALGRLGMPQAVTGITGRLSAGEAPGVRATAAHALGRIGDPQAVPALAACLPDPDYWVAHNAAEALALIGPAGQRALATMAAARGRPARHAREALTWVSIRAVSGPDAARQR